jgi:predicted branched-subunit amino acid permease
MPDAIGFTLLVCAASIGLLYLAVHAEPREHAVAASVVMAVAFPIMLARLEVGAMLLLVAVATRRLRSAPVPDRVPAEWGEY